MTDFILLYFMITAHCLADMCWQPSFIAHNKHRLFVLMVFHALTVSSVISIPMYIFGYECFAVGVIFLISTHILIDTWKSRQPKDDAHFWCLYVDQGAHLLAMIIIVILQ